MSYEVIGCCGVLLRAKTPYGELLVNPTKAVDQDKYWAIWERLNKGSKLSWKE